MHLHLKTAGACFAVIAGLMFLVPDPAVAADPILFDSHAVVRFAGEDGGVYSYDLELSATEYPYREVYLVLDPAEVAAGAEGAVGPDAMIVSAGITSHPDIPLFFATDGRAVANVDNPRLLNDNMMDSFDPDLTYPFPEETYAISLRLGFNRRLSCEEQGKIGYWVGDLRGMIDPNHLFTESDGMPMVEIAIDIKPRSCPNPVNPRRNGVMSVAVLGSEDLDVTTIDPSTILLGGAAPVRHSYEDLVGPPDEVCGCPDASPDGYLDLILKFDNQEFYDGLDDPEDGDEISVELEAVLPDGTVLTGSDCVIVRAAGNVSGGPPEPNQNRGGKSAAAGVSGELRVFSGPVGAAAREIRFVLPEGGTAVLRVVDVAGRQRAVWGPAPWAAGEHGVAFDAAGLSAGIYFARIETAFGAATTKLVVLP
jgi:hypothetical protein